MMYTKHVIIVIIEYTDVKSGNCLPSQVNYRKLHVRMSVYPNVTSPSANPITLPLPLGQVELVPSIAVSEIGDLPNTTSL